MTTKTPSLPETLRGAVRDAKSGGRLQDLCDIVELAADVIDLRLQKERLHRTITSQLGEIVLEMIDLVPDHPNAARARMILTRLQTLLANEEKTDGNPTSN